jgi:DNA-binding NarL/FixJ family response regulator
VLEHEPVIVNPSYSDKWCELIKADPLTERELEVEKLINDGNSHNAVALKLHIAKGTIANLITRVRVKRAYQSLKK